MEQDARTFSKRALLLELLSSMPLSEQSDTTLAPITLSEQDSMTMPSEQPSTILVSITLLDDW